MLSSPIGRLWRIFGTGLGFAVFGVGALLISVTVCPLLALTSPNREVMRNRIQVSLHGGCHFVVWLMGVLGVIRYRVHGRNNLPQRESHTGATPVGKLILANHPSLIDAVFMLAWTPHAVCIVKQSLRENPFLRWAMSWSGYVSNGTPEQLIQDCVDALKAGHSLIMFPEGTRSVPGQSQVFKRGAAWIALRSGASIVPVRIRCEPPMLTKGTKWYQVPARPSQFDISIGASMPATNLYTENTSQRIAAEELTHRLEILLDPALGSVWPAVHAGLPAQIPRAIH